MTLEEYKAYFEQIAISHEDIRHKESVDGIEQNRFCTFDPEEIGVDDRFNLDSTHFGLYLKTFTTKYIKVGSHTHKAYLCGYAVFKACQPGDLDAKAEIESESEQICEDIYQLLQYRMKCEGDGFLTIGSSTRLRIDENDEVYDAEPAAGIANNLCGYDANITFYEHKDHNRRRNKFS